MCITQGINASRQTRCPRWHLTLLPWSFGPSKPHHFSIFGHLRWQNALSNSHAATLITKKRTTEKHCNKTRFKNSIAIMLYPRDLSIGQFQQTSVQRNKQMTIGMILHKCGPACSRCTWRLPFFDSNNTCKHLSLKCAQNAEVHPQICIIIIGNHFSTTRKDLSKPHKKHCHLLCIVLFVVSTSNHTAKIEPSGEMHHTNTK